MRRRRMPPFIAIALIVLAVAGAFYGFLRYSQTVQDDNDFIAPWVAANHWLSTGGSPYEPVVRERVLSMSATLPVEGARVSDRTVFLYPFYAMIFFAPFGLIEFSIARALWMTLLLLATVGTVNFSLRLTGFTFRGWELAGFAVFALVWYYGAGAVMLGQFTVLIVFLMVFGLYLLIQRQDTGAGIVLAFAMARPELAIFLCSFVLLWSLKYRRGRVVAGFFAGLFFLVTISLVLKPGWIGDYLTLWVASAGLDGMASSIMAMVAHTARGIKNQMNLALHGLVLVFLVVNWLVALRNQRLFLWTAMLTLVLGDLLVFRARTTYAVMLLPALFYVYKLIEERVGAGVLITWVLTVLAIAVPWALVFLNVTKTGVEPLAMFTLPPLALLVLLGWTRWWAVRPAKLPFEDLRDRIGP